MKQDKVLIVEDEPEMLNTLEEILAGIPVKTEGELDSKHAIARLKKEDFDLVVTDIKMDGCGGIELLREAKKIDADLPVILITAYPEAGSAISALRCGASDYLVKPFHPDELCFSVKKWLDNCRIKKENLLLKHHFQHKYQDSEFIGGTKAVGELLRWVRHVADMPANVLITGASGTGKEVIAHLIHNKSRHKGLFVPIDCAAIPASLMEGELFGHEKGAYTGATSAVPGLFEFAKDGTVFLDEICELPQEIQTKLLRVIEDRRVRRIGGREFINISARIIAATNRDIYNEVKEGRFRGDLFYRLNVVHLRIPPLCERRDDISLLTDYYIKKFSRDFNKNVAGFTEEAADILRRYNWPGNVRELQNVIKHAIIFAKDTIIGVNSLPESLTSSDMQEADVDGSFFQSKQAQVEKFEKEYFVKLLKKHTGNVNASADEAKVPLGTAYRLLKKLNINPGQFRQGY